MTPQKHSSIVNFYQILKTDLISNEYGHGILDIDLPKGMNNYLNNLDSSIFTVFALDSKATIIWSIRD